MTLPRFRPSSSLRTPAVLVLGLASGLACTAILKPRDDVQRCSTGDDCEPTGDNRYDAVCRFDPEHSDLDSTKTDKICVADFKPISCDISTNPEHPLPEQIDDCEDLMVACEDSKLGSEGCKRPAAGECNDGLEPNDDGVCVDPDDDGERIINDGDQIEQGVVDQYCKSFFCDDRFVCDRSNEDRPTCVICDDDDPFGQGGCGLLWANGEIAPFYVLGEDLEDQCAGPDAQLDEPLFGECP